MLSLFLFKSTHPEYLFFPLFSRIEHSLLDGRRKERRDTILTVFYGYTCNFCFLIFREEAWSLTMLNVKPIISALHNMYRETFYLTDLLAYLLTHLLYSPPFSLRALTDVKLWLTTFTFVGMLIHTNHWKICVCIL